MIQLLWYSSISTGTMVMHSAHFPGISGKVRILRIFVRKYLIKPAICDQTLKIAYRYVH